VSQSSYGTVKAEVAEVWACHWSPRTHRVVAEMVWTDPLLADQDLKNRKELFGRIAVVHRGEIPIVFKVKRAQVTVTVSESVLHCALTHCHGLKTKTIKFPQPIFNCTYVMGAGGGGTRGYSV